MKHLCAAYVVIILLRAPSAGMLKRTKYSRLRNDSFTSTEDHPQGRLPLKRDLDFDSDFAQRDPGPPSDSGSSALRDFIPRVANIRLQSPISLRGPRGETNRDRTIDGHNDKPLCRKDWCSSPGERFFRHSTFNVSLSTGQNLIHPALLCTKRPITLHRMASLPCPPCSQHRDGLCSLKTPSAVDDCTVVRTVNRAVHHHIKVTLSTHIRSAWIRAVVHKQKSHFLCCSLNYMLHLDNLPYINHKNVTCVLLYSTLCHFWHCSSWERAFGISLSSSACKHNGS